MSRTFPRPVKLVIAILVCELAGIVGSVFTASAIPTWYATLERPSFAPPNWVFGPVWTTLFVLMGVAAYLVWSSYEQTKGKQKKRSKNALKLFGAQLVLNVLWSIIFFGMQNPGAAFLEILVLWAAIVATVLTFAKVLRPAAWLLVPYLAWVSFAAYLNFAIWQLNG